MLLGGTLGFMASIVGVLPLMRRRLGRSPESLVEFSATNNELTGHALVPEATTAEPSLAWITIPRLRWALNLEAALFVSFPIVAALAHA
jgi:hypothetical protein